MMKRCRHRWCRARFDAGADDLLFCPSCREELLRKEAAVLAQSGYGRVQLAEAIATTEYWREWRSPFDYRVIDENGREVWASDLIKRYKRETKPRPIHKGNMAF